jgi:hypothetical protein
MLRLADAIQKTLLPVPTACHGTGMGASLTR